MEPISTSAPSESDRPPAALDAAAGPARAAPARSATAKAAVRVTLEVDRGKGRGTWRLRLPGVDIAMEEITIRRTSGA
jgi:hypothetical protein